MKDNFEKRFDEVIKGIDKLNVYDGWWSTYTGVDFGINKKKELEQFFKEELKRITDLMIGEEKNIGKLVGFINNVSNGGSINYKDWNEGYNKHRQHCIDIIEKEIK